MPNSLSWVGIDQLDGLPCGLSALVCGDPEAVQQFLYRYTRESLRGGMRTSLVETVVPPAFVLGTLGEQFPRGKAEYGDGTLSIDVLPPTIRENLRVIDCSLVYPRWLADADALVRVDTTECEEALERSRQALVTHSASMDGRSLLSGTQGVFSEYAWPAPRRELPRGAGLPFVDRTTLDAVWGETVDPHEIVRRAEPTLSEASKSAVERSDGPALGAPTHVVVHRLDEFWDLYSEERVRSTLNGVHQRIARTENFALAGFGRPIESAGVRAVSRFFDLRLEVRTRGGGGSPTHPVADVASEVADLQRGQPIEVRVDPVRDIPRLEGVDDVWYALSP